METKFKAGDAVCYKTHPNIRIGYVSSAIQYGDCELIFDGVEKHYVPIHVSDAWAKHFGHGVCPNSMQVDEDTIMLFTAESKTELPVIDIPLIKIPEMNVKVVERYKPKLTHHYGHIYNDILDIADIVYVLNIDGKDSFTTYATKEEAEQAALKYNKENYLKELECKAEVKLQEMTKFRFRLSHLNYLYSIWKHEKKYTMYGGKEYFDSFREDNPVIAMLPPNEQHKCYLTLMKALLKNRIAEYYKIKKEYLDIKKKIEKVKNS